MPRREEHPEPPVRSLRLLGVDQTHGPQPRIADHRVAGDQPAAVMADDCDLVEFQQVDDAADAADVLVDGERRGGVEPARAGAGEVDQVAGDMVDQVREEGAERRPAHGPTVDEQHVGPAADPAMGDLARTDVEEAVGRSPEQIGGIGRRERGHGNLLVVVMTTI